MAKYDRKQLMARVQTSIGELHLSSLTVADKKRLYYVEQGLLALDEEQALLKSGIEEILDKYQETVSARGNNAEAELVKALKGLVSEPRPRVAYPDRKLLETPRREIPIRGPAPPKSTVRQLVSVQKNLGGIPKTKAKVK